MLKVLEYIKTYLINPNCTQVPHITLSAGSVSYQRNSLALAIYSPYGDLTYNANDNERKYLLAAANDSNGLLWEIHQKPNGILAYYLIARPLKVFKGRGPIAMNIKGTLLANCIGNYGRLGDYGILDSFNEDEDNETAVQIFNVGTGKLYRTLTIGRGRDVLSIAFNIFSNLIAIGGYGRDEGEFVEVWDVETGTLCYSFTAHGYSVTFSLEGNILASSGAGNKVYLWDMSTGNLHHTFTHEESGIVFSDGDVSHGHTVSLVFNSISTDGYIRYLARANDFNQIIIWDVRTKKEVHSFALQKRYLCDIVFSPGLVFIAGGGGRYLRTWFIGEKPKGHHFLKGHKSSIESLTFSPDGNLLASRDTEGIIKVWFLNNILERWSLEELWKRISMSPGR